MERFSLLFFRLTQSLWNGLKSLPGLSALARSFGLSALKNRLWRYETRLPDGTVLKHRAHDLCVINEVAKEDVYGLFRIKPGETVVDCGAHIGAFALMAARKVGPSGRVLAVEPGPESGALLAENAARAGLAQLDIRACALGDRDGVTELYLGTGPEGNPAADTVFPTADRRAMRVPMRRLDGVLKEERLGAVDHLKIDVEGAELMLLAGARETLARTRRVVMEVHPERLDPEAVLSVLKSAGFSCQTLSEKPLLIEASR